MKAILRLSRLRKEAPERKINPAVNPDKKRRYFWRDRQKWLRSA